MSVRYSGNLTGDFLYNLSHHEDQQLWNTVQSFISPAPLKLFFSFEDVPVSVKGTMISWLGNCGSTPNSARSEKFQSEESHFQD